MIPGIALHSPSHFIPWRQGRRKAEGHFGRVMTGTRFLYLNPTGVCEPVRAAAGPFHRGHARSPAGRFALHACALARCREQIRTRRLSGGHAHVHRISPKNCEGGQREDIQLYCRGMLGRKDCLLQQNGHSRNPLLRNSPSHEANCRSYERERS
jgi:hypothetical protein